MCLVLARAVGPGPVPVLSGTEPCSLEGLRAPGTMRGPHWLDRLWPARRPPPSAHRLRAPAWLSSLVPLIRDGVQTRGQPHPSDPRMPGAG